MQSLVHPEEDRVFRLGAGTVGGVLFASSGLAADQALQHMALLGTICGAGPVPHCVWCYSAAGLLMAALAAFFAAFRPRKSGLLQVKAELVRT